MKFDLRKLGGEVISFLGAGLMSFLLTLAVLNFCLLVHVPLFWASILGYGAGVVSSFLLNKKFTFHVGAGAKKSYVLFMEFLAFNIFMMVVFAKLNLVFATLFDIKIFAQVSSIFITTCVNFVAYKFLIFRPRK